jgi:DNA/RNA endonuclease G (NUC1)
MEGDAPDDWGLFPRIALALLADAPAVFASDVCTPPPVWDSRLPPCEYPRKITVHGSIVSCYDPAWGFPAWSASEMDPKSSHSFDREGCVWRRDKSVGSVSPTLYTGTGYARGHLIAFADSSCESGASETCVTSNTIPQPGAQNSGVWAQLERHIREIAASGPNKKWLVIAGPRMGNPVAWLKPGLARPNGIWKVLINATDGSGCGYMSAYLKPYVIQYVPVITLGIKGVRDGNREICAGER